MRLSKNLIDKLKHLYAGGSIAASALKGHWVDELLSERILFTETHGSRRSYRVRDKEAFMLALSLYNEALRDLGQARSLLDSDGSPERSLQAAMTGNSKIMRKGSCPGFPVNSYSPVVSILNGQPFTINPPEGSFIFISDWECFSIPIVYKYVDYEAAIKMLSAGNLQFTRGDKLNDDDELSLSKCNISKQIKLLRDLDIPEIGRAHV